MSYGMMPPENGKSPNRQHIGVIAQVVAGLGVMKLVCHGRRMSFIKATFAAVARWRASSVLHANLFGPVPDGKAAAKADGCVK